MIKSNNNFNRILSNTMTIMKNSIIKSEDERKKGSIKGNFYNYEKCDVCNKYIDESKNEILSCFGCGHQSHEYCAYREKEDYESECFICKQSEIIDEHVNLKKERKIVKKDKDEESKEKDNQNVINIEENKDNKEKEKEDNWFGNRDDNIKKLNDYDNCYLEMIREI